MMPHVLATCPVVKCFAIDGQSVRVMCAQNCNNAVVHGGNLADKLKLSLAMSRLKNLSSQSQLTRCHGVGAVGYAVVQPDDRVPQNHFFQPQQKFRVRFRFVRRTDAVIVFPSLNAF